MKTKALEDFFRNNVNVHYDENGQVIEDPAKLLIPHSKKELIHRMHQLREEYKRIESGKANTPSELEAYAHAFLRFYKDVYGREYPHIKEFLDEIEKYMKWLGGNNDRPT